MDQLMVHIRVEENYGIPVSFCHRPPANYHLTLRPTDVFLPCICCCGFINGYTIHHRQLKDLTLYCTGLLHRRCRIEAKHKDKMLVLYVCKPQIHWIDFHSGWLCGSVVRLLPSRRPLFETSFHFPFYSTRLGHFSLCWDFLQLSL